MVMGDKKDRPDIEALIDRNLRRVYDSVLNEDVPDRFAELLRRLETNADDAPQDRPSRRAAQSGGEN